MFERFTDRARRVVVLAQEEARVLKHDHIGTEHLLLGLVNEGEGLAAKALEALGIHLDAVRHEVEETIDQGDSTPSGHIPFTPQAKTVLELSLREALQLGHNYLGTEHILLGLVREGEGVAAQVLAKLGADLTRVRQVVNQLLAGAPPETSSHLVASDLLSAGLSQAGREAAERGHEVVGTEHLLLWLLGQVDSGAVRALQSEGVDLDALRSRLDQLLEEGNGSTDPQP